MNKRMTIMLCSVGALFALVFGYHAFRVFMMNRYFSSHQNPAVTVSAITVHYQAWQPEWKASANLRAVQGVAITTELAGIVKKIYFTPGELVKANTVLVQLNATSDTAQLHSLQAKAGLAETIYKRDKSQYAIKAISKATLDTDRADLKSQKAQVDQQAAIVEKKTIRAPFAGRLGISAINVGQYLTPGDKITSLESLDPIYADFYVPQQALVQLHVGQPVSLTIDSYPAKIFQGVITTIDSAIDPATRNVEVEATLSNAHFELVPGMFGSIKVTTGEPKRYLTVPQTAISFNPYGNIVYVIKKQPVQNGKNASSTLVATQVFVTTGETRGDEVSILEGLKEGDCIVSSGQLKLKNGSQVVIDRATSTVDESTISPLTHP